MNSTRYSDSIKADDNVNYDIQPFHDELKKRIDDTYAKLLSDNNLDPEQYRRVCRNGYVCDDFIYNKFTIQITAVSINEQITTQPNFYNFNEKNTNPI